MKESNYPIKKVIDNKEKGLSFRENFNRYNKAKASEFYLECLWILYAMLEDRTSAFLYYLGFTDTKKRESVIDNAEIKTQVRQIFNMTKPKARYNFDSMKGKLSRIKEVLDWSSSANQTTEYQQALKKAMNNFLTNQEFMHSLEYLNDYFKDKTLKGRKDCPEVKAYNCGAMLPYMGYQPRTLKEIILSNTNAIV